MEKKKTKKEKNQGISAFWGRCIISILLIIALTVLAVPQTVNALGESIAKKQQSEIIDEVIERDAVETYKPDFDVKELKIDKTNKPYIELEDVNRRTETEKHFYMSDGTYMSETYAEPIHFRDASGNFKDIDNSLITFSEANEQKIKNASNSFSAEFSANLLKDKPLVSLGNGEYKLNMYLDTEFEESLQNDSLLLDKAMDAEGLERSANKAEVEVNKQTSNKNKIISRAEISDVDRYAAKEVNYKDNKLREGIRNDNLKSELKFRNVVDGTDLQYIVEQNAVKENIIVNYTKEKYEYRFIVEAEGLSLYLLKEGNIQALNDTGDLVYEIPAPFMFDASQQYSNDVSYKLEKIEDYKYELMVIADEEWINAGGRDFPVTIDPTVEIYNKSGNFRIKKITNSGVISEGNWYVRDNTGTSINDNVIERLVVRYNKTIPDNYVVLSSKLNFYVRKTENKVASVVAHVEDKQYTTLNWSYTTRSNEDIITLLKNEVSTQWTERTMAIKNESCDMVFSECGTLGVKVEFIDFKVTQTYVIGAHERQDFENDMFKLSVNLLNHKASLTIPYYLQEAPILPISIYGIYTPAFSDLKSFFSKAGNYYGVDWKLNIEQNMVQTPFWKEGGKKEGGEKEEGKMDCYYTYIDENGNPIILDTNENNYYVNESGLAYNPEPVGLAERATEKYIILTKTEEWIKYGIKMDSI